MNDYNLDDDDDPIGEPIFCKSITQEDRMLADLKEDSRERRREHQMLYHVGRKAALECAQEIRQRNGS